MKVKRVPLQDLELWPDEVICFSAYTDTRNPVQQRRTYVDGAALKAENAKLRELVRRYSEYTDQDRCEGCVYKSRCNDGYVDECWQLTEIQGLARELGIEVDE